MPKKQRVKKVISIDENKHPMLTWFRMSDQDVLNAFAKLPNAKYVDNEDPKKRWVYVPGTKENKVLMVAHCDTVQSKNNQTVFPAWCDGVYFSAKKDVGLGADDRAGCNIAWDCQDSGHSILITSGEESGCIAAGEIGGKKEWQDIIDEHLFLIEFDRMGNSDLAFYEVGSLPFKDWCESAFEGYKRVTGSRTDICELCKNVCGVNISVGYYDQHGSAEHLIEKEFLHTLEAVRKMLSMNDLKKWPLEKPIVSSWRWNSPNNNDTSKSTVVQVSYKNEDCVVCAKCDALYTEVEHRQNGGKCIYCQEKF